MKKGRRILGGSGEPLRGVVALQCNDSVRLFRRGRQPDRVRLGRERRGACGKRSFGSAGGSGCGAQDRNSQHCVRPHRHVCLHRAAHAARNPRDRRCRAFRRAFARRLQGAFRSATCITESTSGRARRSKSNSATTGSRFGRRVHRPRRYATGPSFDGPVGVYLRSIR